MLLTYWSTLQGCWLIRCWVLPLLLSSGLRAEKALLGCWVLGCVIDANQGPGVDSSNIKSCVRSDQKPG
jgi:hypothetical protein